MSFSSVCADGLRSNAPGGQFVSTNYELEECTSVLLIAHTVVYMVQLCSYVVDRLPAAARISSYCGPSQCIDGRKETQPSHNFAHAYKTGISVSLAWHVV